MKKLFMIIALICSPYLGAYQYYLTVCAIFRDDAPYLKEWVEFHVERGIEHFYLYNNLSKDNYIDVLKPFLDKGIVTLIEWPYEHAKESEWYEIQCNSYLDCAQRIKNEAVWCAFIDTDEFLFSPKGNLPAILKKEFESYSGVGVNWIIYGTSNVEKVPDGERLVDCLVNRAKTSYLGNRYVKTIAKPKCIKACSSPHYFLYTEGMCVNENHEIVGAQETKTASVKKLRINHYTTRDLHFLYNVKIPRSKSWTLLDKYSDKNLRKLNEVYDPIISKKSPRKTKR